jgi:DNA-binding transcriptional LysR family regulator
MSFIFPALSAQTPLASLAGLDLVLRCPKCGGRRRTFDDLSAKVGRWKTVGNILPRLSCDACRSKPIGMTLVSDWAVTYGRAPLTEDLTFLLNRLSEVKAA